MNRSPLPLFVALVAFYAVLGLIVLAPEAVYSGDIGIKFVQARALLAHRFTSLNIPYPGQFMDAARDFFPMRPPFVMSAAGGTQAIFSPAPAVIQAVAVALAGLRGMILLSVCAGAVTLYAAWKLAAPGQEAAVLMALGLGGPLWFYAVSGSEHALAVACGTAAFACAVVAPARRAPLLAGLLVGVGSTFRDEVLLLLPGLLLVVWFRTRAIRPILTTVAAAAAPLVCAAVLEVWWFGRPAAAHLRHAVHLAQKAAHLTSAPNIDLPVLAPFTMRQRYETVVQYWLLGYGNDRMIALFGATLAAALALRWRWRSSLGLLIWLTAILALGSLDLWEVVTAPKWLAGLHRVSPYLVFALLPPPDGVERRRFLSLAVLCAAVMYLLIAAAGVDTTGGKSLGPRLLLPLFPLLAVTALERIGDYARARAPIDRWIGRAGTLLVLMAVVIHVFGTIPAYTARNRADASAVLAAAAAPESIVLADDEFTAQLLFPLYYEKVILLVDTPELGRAVARRLVQNHVSDLIMVSRRSTAQISLRPFDLERLEPVGRMTIQHWRLE